MNIILLSIIILGLAGLSFAALLAFLSKKLYVKEDARVGKIMDVLPGINCGACGFIGCRAYAQAVAKENQLFSGCLPGGPQVNNVIVSILGVKPVEFSGNRNVALCRCCAGESDRKASHNYDGPLTCRAANIIGGVIDCAYGCLSFGDCISVCPVNAITLENKKIKVDIRKCIACGKCVEVCPRSLFELVPVKDCEVYTVACNNTERGPGVRSVCTKGCIGCGICARVPDSPFFIKDNLAYIDYKNAVKSSSLEEASKKCPAKCIVFNIVFNKS